MFHTYVGIQKQCHSLFRIRCVCREQSLKQSCYCLLRLIYIFLFYSFALSSFYGYNSSTQWTSPTHQKLIKLVWCVSFSLSLFLSLPMFYSLSAAHLNQSVNCKTFELTTYINLLCKHPIELCLWFSLIGRQCALDAPMHARARAYFRIHSYTGIIIWVNMPIGFEIIPFQPK